MDWKQDTTLTRFLHRLNRFSLLGNIAGLGYRAIFLFGPASLAGPLCSTVRFWGLFRHGQQAVRERLFMLSHNGFVNEFCYISSSHIHLHSAFKKGGFSPFFFHTSTIFAFHQEKTYGPTTEQFLGHGHVLCLFSFCFLFPLALIKSC